MFRVKENSPPRSSPRKVAPMRKGPRTRRVASAGIDDPCSRPIPAAAASSRMGPEVGPAMKVMFDVHPDVFAWGGPAGCRKRGGHRGGARKRPWSVVCQPRAQCLAKGRDEATFPAYHGLRGAPGGDRGSSPFAPHNLIAARSLPDAQSQGQIGQGCSMFIESSRRRHRQILAGSAT